MDFINEEDGSNMQRIRTGEIKWLQLEAGEILNLIEKASGYDTEELIKSGELLRRMLVWEKLCIYIDAERN